MAISISRPLSGKREYHRIWLIFWTASRNTASSTKASSHRAPSKGASRSKPLPGGTTSLSGGPATGACCALARGPAVVPVRIPPSRRRHAHPRACHNRGHHHQCGLYLHAGISRGKSARGTEKTPALSGEGPAGGSGERDPRERHRARRYHHAG